MKLAFIWSFLGIVAFANSSKIMFWMPFTFKSAMVAYMPLVEELAKRGHEVNSLRMCKKKKSKVSFPFIR